MRLALVYICLAARPGESLRAVAREGAGGVHANPIVFAWRTCKQQEKVVLSHLNIELKYVHMYIYTVI